MKSGDSKWITSRYARQDVQKFRAKSSVLLTTSSTILNDDPLLNIRYQEFDKKTISIFPKKMFQHPIRVIIDSKNRVQPSHKIMQTEGQIWLIRLRSDHNIWPKNTTQIIRKEYNKKIDIFSLFKFLGTSEINNVWIEAGSTLSGFLLNSFLIDELIIYMAPKILGDKAKPLCIINDILKISNALQFTFQDICHVGPDIRFILSPKKYNFNI